MNYNPYAAPQAPAPAAPLPPGAGPPMPWEIGEVVGQAWEIFKVQWAPLIFAPVVAFLIMMIPSLVAMGVLIGIGFDPANPDLTQQLVSNGASVIGQVIYAFF